MTKNQDIRWMQRLNNYDSALQKLSEAIQYLEKNKPQQQMNILDEIIKEGLIQRFEYTHELAWNLMKDYAHFQGIFNIAGSRDATRYAYQAELIAAGDVWMDMISSRNQTSHTYNEEIALEIFTKVVRDYHQKFLSFQKKMQTLKEKEERI